MEEVALIIGAILLRWMANGTLTKLLNATLFKPKTTGGG